jgi:(p)ppGpp synthase/HD superfamily hydrolase
MAVEFHENQLRKNGDTYALHCLNVAYYCLDWGMTDVDGLCAALLHESLLKAPPENNNRKHHIQEFDQSVANIVEKLTEIQSLQNNSSSKLKFIYQIIMEAASKDLRIFIINTADIFINSDTLYLHSPSEAKNLACSYLINIGIARCLGMVYLANTFIDSILPYIMPAQSSRAHRALDMLMAEQKNSIEELDQNLSTITKSSLVQKVEYEKRVVGEFFSLTDELGKCDLEQIDLPILRIKLLVENDDIAYQVMDKVHDLLDPVPDHFHDYFKNPCENGFRVLSSQVVWKGKPVIIQIALQKDDLVNSMGVLADWNLHGPNVIRHMQLLATQIGEPYMSKFYTDSMPKL